MYANDVLNWLLLQFVVLLILHSTFLQDILINHCSTVWLSALFLPYIHNLVQGGLRSGLMISLHFMLSFHLAYPERAMLSIIVCKGFLHFHWLAKIAREDYL